MTPLTGPRIAAAVLELAKHGYLSEQTLESLNKDEYAFVLAEVQKQKEH